SNPIRRAPDLYVIGYDVERGTPAQDPAAPSAVANLERASQGCTGQERERFEFVAERETDRRRPIPSARGGRRGSRQGGQNHPFIPPIPRSKNQPEEAGFRRWTPTYGQVEAPDQSGIVEHHPLPV